MPTNKRNNERIKRRYYAYLKEANRYSEATIDGVAGAIAMLEASTKWRDFRGFHHEQAIAFKRQLATKKGAATGKPMSKATLQSTPAHLKRFFRWLAGQPGYRSRFTYSD